MQTYFSTAHETTEVPLGDSEAAAAHGGGEGGHDKSSDVIFFIFSALCLGGIVKEINKKSGVRIKMWILVFLSCFLDSVHPHAVCDWRVHGQIQAIHGHPRRTHRENGEHRWGKHKIRWIYYNFSHLGWLFSSSMLSWWSFFQSLSSKEVFHAIGIFSVANSPQYI